MDRALRAMNAEMAQLVAMLEERGLIEVYLNEEGLEVDRLTGEGVRVGHMLAMGEGEDADEVLHAPTYDRVRLSRLGPF